MNQKKGIKVGFIAAAIALLIVAVAVPAGAGDLCKKHDLNRLLKGDYAGTVTSCSCALDTWFQRRILSRKTESLDAPLSSIGANANGTSQGVLSFDGKGNYTFEGKIFSCRKQSNRSNPGSYIPRGSIYIGVHARNLRGR